MIFKKGDRLEHKNWRPISLINVDYKVCARVWAGRLLKVITTSLSILASEASRARMPELAAKPRGNEERRVCNDLL